MPNLATTLLGYEKTLDSLDHRGSGCSGSQEDQSHRITITADVITADVEVELGQ